MQGFLIDIVQRERGRGNTIYFFFFLVPNKLLLSISVKGFVYFKKMGYHEELATEE